MADTFSKEKRMEIMQRVKSANNRSTELRFITLLESHNIHGWIRNYPVKGKPDFVFLKERVAVFIDGCFWHGHDCRNTRPSDNMLYWQAKRERNINRDKEINQVFINRGWQVVRVWECELKKKNEQIALEKIFKVLN